MHASIITNFKNTKNKIFEIDILNDPDGYNMKYYDLKKVFKYHNINLATPDINPIKKSKLVIYIDIPEKIEINNNALSVLIINENQNIYKKNWNKKLHSMFDIIFTWHDEYVDNELYHKFNYSFKIPKNINDVPFKEKKFLTMIAMNQKNSSLNNLYYERLAAIKWCEKNLPEDFDLYGKDWNKIVFENKLLNYINKKTSIFDFFKKNRISYKGKLKNKSQVLMNYKFAFSYENTFGLPGYITEKIFHCFFNGVIPIYLGANNIIKYIPKNCFIDKRDYNNYYDLISDLKKIDEDQYYEYLKNIRDFLKSKNAKIFNSSYWANNTVEKIINLKKFKNIVHNENLFKNK